MDAIVLCQFLIPTLNERNYSQFLLREKAIMDFLDVFNYRFGLVWRNLFGCRMAYTWMDHIVIFVGKIACDHSLLLVLFCIVYSGGIKLGDELSTISVCTLS